MFIELPYFTNNVRSLHSNYLGGLDSVNAQPPSSMNLTTNISKLFEEKYTRIYKDAEVGDVIGPTTLQDVKVRYESPLSILMSADLITPIENAFNFRIWEAMDILKSQYGYKVQQVMTSGEGS